MLTLRELLKLGGIDTERKVSLFRHVNHKNPAWEQYPARNGEIDVEKVYQNNLMPEFQCSNGKSAYGDDVILFFISEEDRRCRFIGAYKIKQKYPKGKRCKSELAVKAEGNNFYNFNNENWFELQEIESLQYLIDRLVVLWSSGPGGTRILDPSRPDIEIIQIRPKNQQLPFPGFNRLIMSYQQLTNALGTEGNTSWQDILRETKGVYLISDTVTGNLYVGSATGADGFLGRWHDYKKTGHGGNKKIKLGIELGEINVDHFQLSILETLSNLASRDDGIIAEQTWKRKLGKKATSLNGNF